MLFDQPYYLKINQARWDAAESILQQIEDQTPLLTCLDLGCGPGWFSDKLAQRGLKVHGIDGRIELITLAKERVKEAQFSVIDLELKVAALKLEPADLVFCFGLIYHTENPFAVIRNLAHLTSKILLVESIVVAESNPVAWLVEEGQNETQGLTYHALIPSRICLVKMLQVSGFSSIYEYQGVIDHEDFTETADKFKRRTLLLAAKEPITLEDFQEIESIKTPKYNFGKNHG